MEPAIRVEGLSKRFRKSPAGKPHTLQEAFLSGFPFNEGDTKMQEKTKNIKMKTFSNTTSNINK